MHSLHQQVHGMQRRLDEGHEETKEVLKSFGVANEEEKK